MHVLSMSRRQSYWLNTVVAFYVLCAASLAANLVQAIKPHFEYYCCLVHAILVLLMRFFFSVQLLVCVLLSLTISEIYSVATYQNTDLCIK